MPARAGGVHGMDKLRCTMARNRKMNILLLAATCLLCLTVSGSFIMKGDGLEVYCDGSVKWTIDRNASEAVAESFDREHPDYLANPALIVGDVSRVFSVVSENSSSFGGKSVTALHLVPQPGLKGISSAVLYLSGAESPVPAGLEMKMDDGIILTLTVTSFALTSRTDSSSFSCASLFFSSMAF